MNVIKLPDSYECIKKIDFVRNRKEVIIVNVISVTLTVLMFTMGVVIYGTDRLSELLLTDSFERFNGLVFKCLVAIVVSIFVIVVHEMIHGFFMKMFCKECKLKFRFRLFYAYASSNAYYKKGPYNIIAAAPLLIIGLILAVACHVVPIEWFWVVYIGEIINVSGAAADIYVFSIISRMPDDILISDTGTAMSVYGKE